MTKNEFDILNYVSLRGGAALSDLHKHFAKAFSSNYVVLDLALIHLQQLEYLKSEPTLDNHLDPYAVFMLTPAGAHAMDEYSENTSRLDRAEMSVLEANRLSRRSNTIALLAIAISFTIAVFTGLLSILGAVSVQIVSTVLRLLFQ